MKNRKQAISKELLAKIEFEQETIYQIEVKAEMTTSDAQGIIEVKEDIYDECFSKGLTPEQTADKIIQASFYA